MEKALWTLAVFVVDGIDRLGAKVISFAAASLLAALSMASNVTAVLIAMFCLEAVAAADDGKLYKDYRFGMSEDDIIEASDSGVYDCSDDFGESGWLCLDGQKFVDYDVDIAFGLLDSSLVSVVLYPGEYSEQQYIDIITALSSRFYLMAIHSHDGTFDVLSEMRGKSKAAFTHEVTEFEKTALSDENINYTYVEQSVFKSFASKSKSTTEFLMLAGDNVRAVEYELVGDDAGDVVSFVRFTLPNRVRRIIQEKAQREVEDF